MCGIAGFTGEDVRKIDRMIAALQHRGPDYQQTVVAHGASIGNARLAILDPRPEGNQPMWNDDHTIVITFNGEIYNYHRLRDEEKFICRTETDTEVLVKLYERYGLEFLPRIRGMFAFGIYDTRTRTWHLARDPSGILPLYLALPNGNLHFASETRALLRALPQKPAINYTALSHYLRLQYVPGPETLCEGITSLPPGTLLTWKEGKEARRKFQTHATPMTFATKHSFRDTFPSLMDTVVKDHLVSDRPVGIFLSGGMDSSIILHHMHRHAAKPIRTFTVRFDVTEEEGAQRFNTDAELAKLSAAHYGTAHEELFLTADMFRDAYKDAARALDQPNADSVSVTQFLLAREAKKQVDVVLCGAGGDELFGGYPRYRVSRILAGIAWMPPSLRAYVARCLGYPPDILAMEPGAALAERLLARPQSEIREYVRGDWFDSEATTTLFKKQFETLLTTHYSLLTRDPVRAFMEFDRHLWLPDESLRLADATTLGNGLECRVPFLDQRIVAAAHATKSSWNVTSLRTKALLKDTYLPLLPPHLFSLGKACFYPPLAKWFRRECAPLVLETLEHPRMRKFFQMDRVRKIFEEHRTYKHYALHTLSSLTQLRAWFEEVYDAVPCASS